MSKPTVKICPLILAFVALLLLAGFSGEVEAKKKKKEQKSQQDPYAEYVWPPPPSKARIKLEAVIQGRADVEVTSKLKRRLLRQSAMDPYDKLIKPFAVAIDPEGRMIVSDTASAALIRFDLDEKVMDVLGTRGRIRVKTPMGLAVAEDGTIFVADNGLRQVVAFDPGGAPVGSYGQTGELQNPTDVAISPDEKRLFVADSKAQRVVIFDRGSAEKLSEFGTPGQGDGEFAFPTSLDFGPEGNLYVVDQLNCRIQVFDAEGEYLDQFGERGDGFGRFGRPKDVVVDEVGFIYVADAQLNNVQIFDVDFTLLTFVGGGGRGPGRFYGASGVAVRGDDIAVVDQLGARLQSLRFLVPKDE